MSFVSVQVMYIVILIQCWRGGGYGVTSYCYANPNLDASVMKSGIKDICKRQSPKLVICDVRKFLSSFWYVGLTGSLRDVVDSYDLGLDRLELINYAKEINQIPNDEIIPLIFDFTYYHSNYSALSLHDSWLLIDNRINADYMNQWSIFKGYRPTYVNGVTAYFRGYSILQTAERKSLLLESEQCLRDLIEYCKENGVELLLIETPYVVLDNDDIKETNAILDIANEYSVPFLNFNTQEMYENIGLDFESDLFDRYHVNFLGSVKFTRYLLDYIINKYSLEDHRFANEYEPWQKMCINEYIPFMENYRDQTCQQAMSIKSTINKENLIQSAKDITEWLDLVEDPNLTCLFSSSIEENNDEFQDVCSKFSINPNSPSNFIGTSVDGSAAIYRDIGEYSNEIKMPVGISPIHYSIAADGTDLMITVNQQEYSNEGLVGIFIVVVNSNTAQVVDSVVLAAKGNGVEVVHMPTSSD